MKYIDFMFYLYAIYGKVSQLPQCEYYVTGYVPLLLHIYRRPGRHMCMLVRVFRSGSTFSFRRFAGNDGIDGLDIYHTSLNSFLNVVKIKIFSSLVRMNVLGEGYSYNSHFALYNTSPGFCTPHIL